MGLYIYWSTERTFRSSSGGDILNEATEQLVLDIIEVQNLSYNGNVSSKTIESTAFVSEHFNREPITIRCQCIHTDTPSLEQDLDYSLDAVDSNGTEIVMGRLTNLRNEDATQIDKRRRTVDTLNILQELFETGTELLLDGVDSYDKSWMLINIEVNRSVESAGALFLSLTFNEIIKGFVQETEAPAPLNERGRRKTDRGRTGNNKVKTDAVNEYRRRRLAEEETQRGEDAEAVDWLRNNRTQEESTTRPGGPTKTIPGAARNALLRGRQ